MFYVVCCCKIFTGEKQLELECSAISLLAQMCVSSWEG